MMKFNFTKDQAIAEHRKMWRWIYDETIKQKRPVSKNEYLEKNNIFGLYSDCFLCEYSVDGKINIRKYITPMSSKDHTAHYVTSSEIVNKHYDLCTSCFTVFVNNFMSNVKGEEK